MFEVVWRIRKDEKNPKIKRYRFPQKKFSAIKYLQRQKYDIILYD